MNLAYPYPFGIESGMESLVTEKNCDDGAAAVVSFSVGLRLLF